MSSGVTSSVPRVMAQTGFSGDWMPMRSATSTTCSGPTTVMSWA